MAQRLLLAGFGNAFRRNDLAKASTLGNRPATERSATENSGWSPYAPLAPSPVAHEQFEEDAENYCDTDDHVETLAPIGTPGR